MKLRLKTAIILAHLLLAAGVASAQQTASPEATPTASAIPAASATNSATAKPEQAKTDQASTENQKLADVVVTASTASGMLEDINTISQTIRVIDSEQIEDVHGRNLADVLNYNSLSYTGYTGGVDHAPVQIRGATSGGATQDWDNLSEIAILVNGRPAGTGNVAKLLTYDLDRLEILRGPDSVIYGSQAMGGVINLITKDGLTFQGTTVSGTFGSWNDYIAQVQNGGKEGKLNWYASIAGETRGDYQSGTGSKGTMPNTAFKNGQIDLNLGYEFNDLNSANLILRSGGFYHADHNGVTFSLTDWDNRTGTSAEIIYNGRNPDNTLNWLNHPYFVQDIDQLDWSQNPVIGSQLAPVTKYYTNKGANAPTSKALLATYNPSYWNTYNQPNIYGPLTSVLGINDDNNIRTENKYGDIFEGNWKIIESNKLLIGLSIDYTTVNSTRSRTAADPTEYNAIYAYVFANNKNPVIHYPGLAAQWTKVDLTPINLAPLEYNSQAFTGGLYFEDTQKLLNDKLVLRAGARINSITAQLTDTPYETPGINKNAKSDLATTWTAGGTYEATKWLTLRANVGTGFLAAPPNALYATTAQANGSIRIGNPNLKDETNIGGEVGANVNAGALNFDADWFFNQIHNRITSLSTAPSIANAPTLWSNLNEVNVQGIEFKASYDIAQAAKWKGYKLEPYVTGTYNAELNVNDSFANYPYSNHQLQGVPIYQATVGVRGGKIGKWGVDVYGIGQGGQWGTLANDYYNPAVPTQKWPSGYSRLGPAFWTFNARVNYEVNKNLTLFAGVSNILNLNYDGAQNYTLNQSLASVKPTTAGPNGNTGMSLPGRQFYGGFTFSF